MVTPAVFTAGTTKLLVANPSSSFELLHKGQQISSAIRVVESDEDTLALTTPCS